MLRRYELTDEEWNRIVPLLPPENTGKQGRPRKDNRIILNGMVWLARSVHPGEIFQNVMVPGKLYIVVFVNGLMTGFWIIFFAF